MSDNSLHKIFTKAAFIKSELLTCTGIEKFDLFLNWLSCLDLDLVDFKIISDSTSKWAANHLNEELVVRFKAGAPMGRQDRRGISSKYYSEYPHDVLASQIISRGNSSKTEILICFAAADDSGLLSVLQAAKNNGATTLTLASQNAQKLLKVADYNLSLSTQDPFLLYHLHSQALHLICERLEPDFSEARYGSDVVIRNSLDLDQKLLSNSVFFSNFSKVKDILENCIKNHKSIYLAGNGGSACDINSLIQHLKAQFNKDRFIEIFDLHCPGALLAAFNDGYSPFARQLEASAKVSDIFLAYSTSGNSQNLIEAVKIAKTKAVVTIGVLGKGGGELAKLCDYSIVVPSDETARIQESHALIGAALFEDTFI